MLITVSERFRSVQTLQLTFVAIYPEHAEVIGAIKKATLGVSSNVERKPGFVLLHGPLHESAKAGSRSSAKKMLINQQ